MKIYPLIILLFLLPTTLAYNANTTVTLDFTGNDLYYLRTESGDFGPFNMSDQSDKSYIVNISRVSATNLTEMEQILLHIKNVSITCSNLTDSFEARNKYCNELDVNWTRCNLDKNALMAGVIIYESEKLNLTNTVLGYKTSLNDLQTNYNQIMVLVNNQTETIQGLNKSKQNNLMLGLLIGAGIIGIIWAVKEGDKKKFDRPGEIRKAGFGGR